MGRFLSPFAMPIYANIDVWLMIGFGFGLFLFFRGLRTFRRSLMVADTPTIPIRSVAMGITQVHGRAEGAEAFPSPVSGTSCYAFKVKIERWDNRGWGHHRTDQNGRRFLIADDSGRIRVDPLEADFDLPVNCRRTVGASQTSIYPAIMDLIRPTSTAVDDDVSLEVRTDEQLLEYAGVGYGYQNALHFLEYCIRPGHEYDVLGTCVENPRPRGDDDKNLITKGDHNGTFLISSKSAEQLKQGMGWRSTVMVIGGATLTVFCAALFMARHGLF